MLRAVEQVGEAAATGGLGRLQLRIGVAEGGLLAGLTGAHRQRYQFFGEAVAQAEHHQRRARPGEVRVQAAVAAAAAATTTTAAAADGFLFLEPECGEANGNDGGGGSSGSGQDLLLSAVHGS